MKTFAGLVADCFTIFGEESSEYDWKKFALITLLQFILLKDTRRVCANSLYCLAITLRIKCTTYVANRKAYHRHTVFLLFEITLEAFIVKMLAYS